MEIYRRMGLAGQIRAAGLRADVPMDVYVALALNEPPLLQLKYPSVDEARARDCRVPRRLDAAGAVSAHLAVHARAAAQGRGRTAAERHRAIRLRVRVAVAGCAIAVTRHGAQRATARESTIVAQYLVGCDGGGERGAPAARHSAARRRQPAAACIRRSITVPSCSIGCRSATAPARGRHYHIADAQSTFLIMQDSTRHWTLHARVDRPEDMAAQFERTVGVPVQLRHALRRRVEAESAARRPLSEPAACFSPATPCIS